MIYLFGIKELSVYQSTEFKPCPNWEHFDGWVQHYPKCLYKVYALRIVLHSPIDLQTLQNMSDPSRELELRIGIAKSTDPSQSAQFAQSDHGRNLSLLADFVCIKWKLYPTKLSLWNNRTVSACACFVPLFTISSRSSNKPSIFAWWVTYNSNKCVVHRVENIVGRRKCYLPTLSPFPTLFSKGLFHRTVKSCHRVVKV